MPIMWIREGSPLEIAVESDDGKVLNSMKVRGVSGKNAIWHIADVEERRPSNPVWEKGFRMRRDGDDSAVLAIRFTETRTGGKKRG